MPKRVLTARLPSPGRTAPLSPEEAHHLIQVLRSAVGEEVEAIDGKGAGARARLGQNGDGTFFLEWLAAVASVAIPPLRLELAILKGDAMEWVLEKSVELGVREVVPILAAHSVVKVKGKGPEAFLDRWQRIADQALKQCGRLERMTIAEPRALARALADAPATAAIPRLIAEETARATAPEILTFLGRAPRSGATLLIGPEGGWSEAERELAGTEGRITLGPLVLRAETAAVSGAAIAMSALRSLAETPGKS